MAAPASPMAPEAGEVRPVVRTSYGALSGFRHHGCVAFRGVPYASPPERFRRSVPPQPWTGVRDARKHGRAAMQPQLAEGRGGFLGDAGRAILETAGIRKSTALSEDCLYLNVTTPSLSGSAPVFVWIHGGAFWAGSGSTPLYFGPVLARRADVVVVTINYRLGCWGFLNVPGGDLNCGSWDQLQALRWVHSEIHAFGGDPARITICGQSAGGMSCGVLLASPLAQPYFKRCILMSGAMCNVMSQKDAAGCARQLCNAAGTEVTADALRALSAEDLLMAQLKVQGVMPWQPCVDGELVPDFPLDALARGSISLADKEVMLGWTQEEFALFDLLPAVGPLKKSLDSAAGKLASYLGPERLGVAAGPEEHQDLILEVRALLKESRTEQGTGSWNETVQRILTTLVFAAPCRLAAEALSASAGRAGRVFVYCVQFRAGSLGAAHAVELPLLFGVHGASMLLRMASGAKQDPAGAEAVSKSMIETFGGFMHKGSPTPAAVANSRPTEAWPEFDHDQASNVYVFDKACKVVRGVQSQSMETSLQWLARATRPWGLRPDCRSGPPRSRL